MKTQRSKESSPTIWKFGCNWEACERSFYNFIKNEQTVLGRENWKYDVGDLVVITEGFTVKAIAVVKEEPKSITKNLSYSRLQQDYNITYNDATIFAKADWYELSQDEVFKYKVQRGAARVHKKDIKERVLKLWNSRDD